MNKGDRVRFIGPKFTISVGPEIGVEGVVVQEFDDDLLLVRFDGYSRDLIVSPFRLERIQNGQVENLSR